MENRYIPGVCNIGPEEIAMRIRVGWIGLAVTILLYAILVRIGAMPLERTVVFLPAFVAAIGFLQGWMHFCVAFGSKGLFNMDHAVGQTESVEKAEFRKADQKKAILIWVYAVLSALAIALLAFFF